MRKVVIKSLVCGVSLVSGWPHTISHAKAAGLTCSDQRGVKEYLQTYLEKAAMPLRMSGEAARIELGRVATLGQLGNTLKCAASMTLVMEGLKVPDTLYFDVTPTDDGESMITVGR